MLNRDVIARRDQLAARATPPADGECAAVGCNAKADKPNRRLIRPGEEFTAALCAKHVGIDSSKVAWTPASRLMTWKGSHKKTKKK